MRFRTMPPAAAGCLLVLTAACSTGTTDPGTATASPAQGPGARTSYPLTIDNCGREITFQEPPSRVLLLNGTSVAEVESLIALGVEDRILANGQSYGVSDDPGMVERIAALPTGDLSLNENFEVPREQVLALQPDLVISTWAGGFDAATGSATRDQLAAAGINSLVTPVNCAYGDPAARPEDQRRHDAQSVESSFELLYTLGEIFDVSDRATGQVERARAELAETAEAVAGREPVSVLAVYPGMAMMNNNGLPAVFAGGISDDIVARAGAVNAFAGSTGPELADINAEALATADVDVLVIGLFTADEDAEAYARDLFERFPAWEASRTGTYTTVSDSFSLGPLNALAVARIADAAHSLP
ncbi:ABC transporter substrate-binding protein [Streptomyces sp. XM4011]|uniref:ABC transporter substrate-binding protein n=1 Tax=Streptomyces sp. XM4011 TaxID=2929780 RepID=UPI001FF72A91|nr:ABC transporter substrate-binding protein [Streptomyces sp. XM4011]MCK1817326.1 ABC transporter substrate-binding protein [Streptomyces sp. XM4011]